MPFSSFVSAVTLIFHRSAKPGLIYQAARDILGSSGPQVDVWLPPKAGSASVIDFPRTPATFSRALCHVLSSDLQNALPGTHYIYCRGFTMYYSGWIQMGLQSQTSLQSFWWLLLLLLSCQVPQFGRIFFLTTFLCNSLVESLPPQSTARFFNKESARLFSLTAEATKRRES